jgi:hypothetical protein
MSDGQRGCRFFLMIGAFLLGSFALMVGCNSKRSTSGLMFMKKEQQELM